MCICLTTSSSLSTLKILSVPLKKVHRMVTSVVCSNQGRDQGLTGRDRGVAGRDLHVAVYNHVTSRVRGLASHHRSTLPLHSG